MLTEQPLKVKSASERRSTLSCKQLRLDAVMKIHTDRRGGRGYLGPVAKLRTAVFLCWEKFWRFL